MKTLVGSVATRDAMVVVPQWQRQRRGGGDISGGAEDVNIVIMMMDTEAVAPLWCR